MLYAVAAADGVSSDENEYVTVGEVKIDNEETLEIERKKINP